MALTAWAEEAKAKRKQWEENRELKSKIKQLEQEVKEIKARNEELNLLLARHHELKEENLEMKAFLGGKGYTVDNVKGKALAQHDKTRVSDFVKEVIYTGQLSGGDVRFLESFRDEYFEQLKQEQE